MYKYLQLFKELKDLIKVVKNINNKLSTISIILLNIIKNFITCFKIIGKLN